MKAKKIEETPRAVNENHNVNNTTNNINVSVKVPTRKRGPAKKKEKPNWITKTLVGGVITVVLSVGGYYIKKNLDAKGQNAGSPTITSEKPLEGTRQN